MKFLVIYEKSGTDWSAYVPDLPGVVTTARKTRLKNSLRKAKLNSHLEGLREDNLPIPEPAASAEVVKCFLKSPPFPVSHSWSLRIQRKIGISPCAASISTITPLLRSCLRSSTLALFRGAFWKRVIHPSSRTGDAGGGRTCAGIGGGLAGMPASEIVFTSGGTEADNLAIFGLAPRDSMSLPRPSNITRF